MKLERYFSEMLDMIKTANIKLDNSTINAIKSKR